MFDRYRRRRKSEAMGVTMCKMSCIGLLPVTTVSIENKSNIGIPMSFLLSFSLYIFKSECSAIFVQTIQKRVNMEFLNFKKHGMVTDEGRIAWKVNPICGEPHLHPAWIHPDC